MFAPTLLWLAHTAIEIAGGGGCPDAAVVSRRLASLMPAVPDTVLSGSGAPGATASAAPPSVQLSRTSTGDLDVLLLGSDGRWLDEKRLAGTSPCEDLAVAAAVVIATWVSEPGLSPPDRVDLPRPAADREDPTAVTGRPSLVVAESRRRPVAERPPMTRNLRLGAVASAAAGPWAAGLRMAGGAILWSDRWGLGAVAAATMPRSAPVGAVPEAARWMRGYLGAGPEVAVLSGPVTLRAHLQGLLGLLHLTGNGLEMPTSETGLRFGASAGLWSAWNGWSGVWPWIGADLLFWPGRERLRIEGFSSEGTVPAFEGQIAAGLGIDLFP